MEKLVLCEVVKAVRGEFLLGDPHQPVTRISIDTRSLRKGDFFVALAGKNYDGHHYLREAIAKGAAGLIVSRGDADMGNPFPVFPAVVRVADTLTALGDLAAWYRRKRATPLVAITGSNGKTTTKEMLASILSRSGTTLHTTGNRNNQVGLPLTLLELEDMHRYAVIEMGTSWPGEISRLAHIAAPDIGIITNIGHSHLENLKSLDGVFQEKRALFDQLPPGGCAVLNYDDPYLKTLAAALPVETLTYGLHPSAAVRATDISEWPDTPRFMLHLGSTAVPVALPVYGAFNVYNALAAATAAIKLGIPPEQIREGIEQMPVPHMRMEVHTLRSGALLINDAYNANPNSLRQAVASLVTAFPSRSKIVVAGDMLELGDASDQLHREAVEHMVSQPLHAVYVFGSRLCAAAAGCRTVRCFESKEMLAQALAGALTPETVVLFKGSRGMRLEEIYEHLLLQEKNNA